MTVEGFLGIPDGSLTPEKLWLLLTIVLATAIASWFYQSKHPPPLVISGLFGYLFAGIIVVIIRECPLKASVVYTIFVMAFPVLFIPWAIRNFVLDKEKS